MGKNEQFANMVPIQMIDRLSNDDFFGIKQFIWSEADDADIKAMYGSGVTDTALKNWASHMKKVRGGLLMEVKSPNTAKENIYEYMMINGDGTRRYEFNAYGLTTGSQKFMEKQYACAVIPESINVATVNSTKSSRLKQVKLRGDTDIEIRVKGSFELFLPPKFKGSIKISNSSSIEPITVKIIRNIAKSNSWKLLDLKDISPVGKSINVEFEDKYLLLDRIYQLRNSGWQVFSSIENTVIDIKKNQYISFDRTGLKVYGSDRVLKGDYEMGNSFEYFEDRKTELSIRKFEDNGGKFLISSITERKNVKAIRYDSVNGISQDDLVRMVQSRINSSRLFGIDPKLDRKDKKYMFPLEGDFGKDLKNFLDVTLKPSGQTRVSMIIHVTEGEDALNLKIPDSARTVEIHCDVGGRLNNVSVPEGVDLKLFTNSDNINLEVPLNYSNVITVTNKGDTKINVNKPVGRSILFVQIEKGKGSTGNLEIKGGKGIILQGYRYRILKGTFYLSDSKYNVELRPDFSFQLTSTREVVVYNDLGVKSYELYIQGGSFFKNINFIKMFNASEQTNMTAKGRIQ